MRWINAGDVYRQMLATTPEEREQIYRERLLAPMAGALTIAQYMGGGEGDALDQARAMLWYGPDDLASEPPGLALLETAQAWERGGEALERAISCFTPLASQARIETDVTGTIVLTHPHPAIQVGGGYAGYQVPGHVVVTYHEPTAHNVRSAPGAIAHEYNHRIRLTAYPWDMATTDVAEYVVMEGLAEAFAVALYGPDVLGYYVTQISESDLLKARHLFSQGWHQTGFDTLRAYLFGHTIAQAMGFDQGLDMPDFGGYAVGYYLVDAYLRRTGVSIETATLTPAHTIVQASGFLL